MHRSLGSAVSVVVIVSSICLGLWRGCSNSKSPKGGDAKSGSKAQLEEKGGKVVSADFFNATVTADSITPLAKHDSLRDILFQECKEIDAKAIEELAKLKSLAAISFVRCKLPKGALAHVAKMPTVTSLTLIAARLQETNSARSRIWVH